MIGKPTDAATFAPLSPGTPGEPVTVYYNDRWPLGNLGLLHTEASDSEVARHEDGIGGFIARGEELPIRVSAETLARWQRVHADWSAMLDEQNAVVREVRRAGAAPTT